MKKLRGVHRSSEPHWVGNGFHVRSVFDYNGLGHELTPFLLLMDGEPIAEPIFGRGPFVMNSRAQLDQAFEDYRAGRMGQLPG